MMAAVGETGGAGATQTPTDHTLNFARSNPGYGDSSLRSTRRFALRSLDNPGWCRPTAYGGERSR